MRIMSRSRLPLLLLLLLAWGTAGAAVPKVVASIAPVHSLVSGVMAGVGRPALLLKGYTSPHTYQLRPSDASALANAGVVFWVGEGLESFLAGALGRLAPQARHLALMEAPGMTLLEARSGGLLEPDEASPGHGHGHGAHGLDPHVWLAPANAEAMVEAVAALLAEVDPANAAAYRRNAGELKGRLQELDRALAALLEPVADRRYLVFHDAYQYLEHRYGLQAAGTITASPARMPGARRLSALRDLVEGKEVRCVFSETQIDSPLVQTLVEGTGMRVAELDPLGSTRGAPPDRYFEMMRRNGQAIAECLAGAGGD